MPGHSPGIGLPYAPEQARWLLAEAGYPGGRGFPRLEGRTPRLTVTTEYLTAQWQENLGIEVAWQACSYEEVADLLSRDPPPMIVDGWIADYPDPDSFLRGAVQTYLPGWLNESYSRLVEQARRVTDQRERMKLYQQADRLLVEEAVIVPISYSRLHLLVKPWVTRFPISPLKYWFFKDVVIAPH
jgi:ABC-type oligopeptide transport system substrate-binding subunit